ncbi:MAG TPA: hypothetical protein ENI41_02790 [Deltaproteobacteria bacterium]|nr:hypothetical protein [Deltaproteobacteria bacterium]
MRGIRLCLIFVLFFMIMGVLSAQATVLIPKDFRDLTKEADLVFIGIVTDITCEWSDASQRDIYTYVTFSNLEIVAGEHNEDQIVVRLSGGEIDNIKVEYAGVPEFEIGERDLIFLKGNFTELCPIVGWIQGRFHVEFDQSARTEVILTNDFKPVGEISDNRIVTTRDPAQRVMGTPGTPDTAAAHVMAVQGPETKMTLNSFVGAVKSLRNHLKSKGEILGYSPTVNPRATTIPEDTLNPSSKPGEQKEEVTGYSEVPQPVKVLSIEKNED